MVRRPVLLSVTVLAALVVPGAAAAQFHPVAHLPGVTGRLQGASEEGGDVVVVAQDDRAGRAPVIEVETARGGTFERRLLLPGWRVRDTANIPGGGLDLLVASADDRVGRVLRVSPAGSVRTVWRGAGDEAAVASQQLAVDPHGAGGLIFLRRRTDGSARLLLALGAAGHPFARAHAVGGVLPARAVASPAAADRGYVVGLALTFDSRRRPVVAATVRSRRADGINHDELVLATLDRTGRRLLRRQVSAGVTGLVGAAPIADGRVAVLVEHTGVLGETGVCVADGTRRRIATAIRAAGDAPAFTRVVSHVEPTFACEDVRAALVASGDGRIAVLWGRGDDLGGPSSVVSLTAARGGGFGPPRELAVPGRVVGAVSLAGGTPAALTVMTPAQRERIGPPAIVTGDTAAPLDAFPSALAGDVVATDTAGPDTVAWSSADGIEVGTISEG